MFKPFLTGAVIALSAIALAPVGAKAGDQPHILVLGEDADRDTVPRGSQIFNRVLRAMEEEMIVAGFNVFDETAVTRDITNPLTARRTDAEIITIAERIQRAPIDVATVFQIYANAEQNPYADIMDLRVRVSGRLLEVHSGRALGNFQISYGPGDLPPLPPGCRRECILDNVGEQAERIGRDVANALTVRLDHYAPRPVNGGRVSDDRPLTDRCEGMTTPYTITFRHFDMEEITMIEEYLVSFRGYEHHRPMRTGATEATYWYESCAGSARLTRNLRLMTEHMGVDAQVRENNNRFEIEKLRRPVQR